MATLLLVGLCLCGLSLAIGFIVGFLAIRNIRTAFKHPGESIFDRHLTLMAVNLVAGLMMVGGIGCIVVHFVQKVG